MTIRASNQNSTPSRYDNPFATCWTRPGALPFRFGGGQSVDQLLGKLAAQGWWGEIVGPHGSGKSTLLETLKPALTDAGRCMDAITLRNGQSRLPTEFWHSVRRDGMASPAWALAQRSIPVTREIGNPLLIVDGYEQLRWFERRQLRRHCRRAGAGLLVTSHTPTGLPELARLAPGRCLIEQLVRDLCAQISAEITAEDIAASHACHGSNVREIFFELYHRHERRRRTAGTLAGAIA